MDRGKQKTTILTISTGFLVLYFIFLFAREKELTWMLWVALSVSLLSLLSPTMEKLIHKLWFWVAEKLGFVMSRLTLGIIFLLILTPLGLISRLFRKDFMFLKKRNDSYYKTRNHVFVPEDFNDPW